MSIVGESKRGTTQAGMLAAINGTREPKTGPLRELTLVPPLPAHSAPPGPPQRSRQYLSVAAPGIATLCAAPLQPMSRSLPLPVSPAAGGTVRISSFGCVGELATPQQISPALQGTHWTKSRSTNPGDFITSFMVRDRSRRLSGLRGFEGIRRSGTVSRPSVPQPGVLVSGGRNPSRRAARNLSGDRVGGGEGHDGVTCPTQALSRTTQTPFVSPSASQLVSPSAQMRVEPSRDSVVTAVKVSDTAPQLRPRPVTRSARACAGSPRNSATRHRGGQSRNRRIAGEPPCARFAGVGA